MSELQEDEKKSAVEKLGFVEELEEEVNIMGPGDQAPGNYIATNYPMPLKRLRIVYESHNANVEEPYHWVLNHLKQDQGYYQVEKIVDTMTAAEASSLFGVQMQRLNMQQDKAAQYMGTISSMVKSLFQVVREIRIIKERLAHYRGSMKGDKSSDVALKGYWVDLVEGGGKNPASIYGLAQQLGFATLPDLFFETTIPYDGDVDSIVEERAKGFNRKVREVLRRKLAQFVVWRKETQKELESREKFTLRYLRQHWSTIKMYMSWVKPMLKNIKRLQTGEKYRNNAELLSSMEGSMMEVELLAVRDKIGSHHPIIVAHFLYRTRAHMNFNNDYQRGPVHVGRVAITLRAYAWTPEQIDKYRKLREEEDLELIGMIDGSVEAAMDALGDELRNYLEEAEEEANLPERQKKEETEEKPVKGPGMMDPFVALGHGFKDIALAPFPERNKKGKKSSSSPGNPGPASGAATGSMWQVYKNYKAAHRMLKW